MYLVALFRLNLKNDRIIQITKLILGKVGLSPFRAVSDDPTSLKSDDCDKVITLQKQLFRSPMERYHSSLQGPMQVIED